MKGIWILLLLIIFTSKSFAGTVTVHNISKPIPSKQYREEGGGFAMDFVWTAGGCAGLSGDTCKASGGDGLGHTLTCNRSIGIPPGGKASHKFTWGKTNLHVHYCTHNDIQAGKKRVYSGTTYYVCEYTGPKNTDDPKNTEMIDYGKFSSNLGDFNKEYCDVP